MRTIRGHCKTLRGEAHLDFATRRKSPAHHNLGRERGEMGRTKDNSCNGNTNRKIDALTAGGQRIVHEFFPRLRPTETVVIASQFVGLVRSISNFRNAGSRCLYKADNMDPEDIDSNECASPCATAILLYVAIPNIRSHTRDVGRSHRQDSDTAALRSRQLFLISDRGKSEKTWVSKTNYASAFWQCKCFTPGRHEKQTCTSQS